jgi:hypothetical protein|tara:strand:- start:213 stop:407 length:195 start_codon:yes stop_codon:yes gene_type:complete
MPPPKVETEAVTWVTLFRLADVLMSELIFLLFDQVCIDHFNYFKFFFTTMVGADKVSNGVGLII